MAAMLSLLGAAADARWRAVLALLAGMLAAAALAQAQDTASAQIEVRDAWAPPTIGEQAVGVAYVTLTNNGSTADRLLAARTEGAQAVELHAHTMDGGIMRMRRIGGGIEMPAGATVRLEPGGSHLMLIGLAEPLRAGDAFPLVLTFERAGDVPATVAVRARHRHGPSHRP